MVKRVDEAFLFRIALLNLLARIYNHMPAGQEPWSKDHKGLTCFPMERERFPLASLAQLTSLPYFTECSLTIMDLKDPCPQDMRYFAGVKSLLRIAMLSFHNTRPQARSGQYRRSAALLNASADFCPPYSCALIFGSSVLSVRSMASGKTVLIACVYGLGS